MGNTAVAVLHYDHMGEINWACPPIYEAMRDFPGGAGRELRGYFGFGNVISYDGSGGYQVTVVHGNTGWRLGLWGNAEPVPPDNVLEACAEALRRHGWKVEKPEPKARNRDAFVKRLVAPMTDVERFYKDRIETVDGSSLTATALYEDYIDWCNAHAKAPLVLPAFGREFGDLGVQKAKIAGRVRYVGVELKR